MQFHLPITIRCLSPSSNDSHPYRADSMSDLTHPIRWFPPGPRYYMSNNDGIGRPLLNTSRTTKAVWWTSQTTSPSQPKTVTIHRSMNPPKINHFRYKISFTPLFTLFVQLPLTIQKSRCDSCSQRIRSQTSAIAPQTLQTTQLIHQFIPELHEPLQPPSTTINIQFFPIPGEWWM